MKKLFFLPVLLLVFLVTGSVFAQDDNSSLIWSRVKVDKNARTEIPAGYKYIPAPQAPRHYKSKNIEAIIGPNVRPLPTTNSTQSEMSIDMHPTNPQVILASANATNGPSVTTIYGTGVYYTTNGGTNWTGYDNPPFGTNSGDPAAVIGTNGIFGVGFIDGGANDGGQGIGVSTNSGANWSRYVVAAKPPGASDLLDKNHMWIDKKAGSPYENRMYAAWTDFISGNPNNYKLGFKYSSNGGQTWSTQKNISTGITAYLNQGVNIQTGPNGEVYVAWAIYEDNSVSTGEDAIGFNVSTDGGETWGTPKKIYVKTNFGIRGTLSSKASIRVSSFPSMTVNRNTGAIYITFPQKANQPPTGNSIDIVMIKSTDGGNTWAAPVRVNNDDLNNSKDQYYPWAVVDQSTGGLFIVFYDSRNVRNDSAEVYMAYSNDGGATFENFKVSDAPFKPKTISGLASGYQGDYIGVAAVNNTVYPYWMDDRTGVYQGWTCKVVVATYPLNPFNLTAPAAGVTMSSFPNSGTQYNFTWDTSASTASYRWVFGTVANPRILSIPAGSNQFKFTAGQLDTWLEGLNVAQGDSIVGQWNVWAYRNNAPQNDSLVSANGPRALTLKRGVPQLTPFSLVAPDNGTTIVTSSNNTTPVQIKWTRSGEGIRYKWKFRAPTFAGTNYFDVSSDNGGYDTVLTVQKNVLDGMLTSIGLATGDSIVGQWKVYGYRNPQDSLGSTNTFDIILKRQALGDYLVVYDSSSANCRISKDSILANLNLMGATYDLKNRGTGSSTITFSMRGYKKVIWLGEGTSVLSVAQKDSIKGYLASGGTTAATKAKLMIFGEDIGYSVDRTGATYYDSAFARQQLGFQYVLDRPSTGGAQGLINLYSYVADSTIGTWPDVLRRSASATNTFKLYGFRLYGITSDSVNAIGHIGSTYNTATYGVDLESMRPTAGSPAGSPVARALAQALDFVNETLAPPTPVIAVTAPNGGENWLVGSTKNITWSSVSVNNVKIEHSTNNGTAWTTVTASVPASPASYTWTVPNTVSTQNLIRVSDASNAAITDVSNAVFTISTPPPTYTWESVVTVKDAGNVSLGITMGMAPTATNGIDVALGEISLPPAPPTGVFDARYELPVTPPEFSAKDYRRDTLQSAAWIMKFQPGAGGYPMTFSWNIASLPAGSFMLKDMVTGTVVNVDMKSVNTYTLTNTGITSLKIEFTKQTCVAMTMAADWNMVGVPVQAADMSATALFAGANSAVYGYNNGYVTATTLSTGKGYWVRYPSAANFNICGNTVSGTIPLASGWNMVAVFDKNVAASGITTTPAGIINSVFYGFNAGYQQATTLNAGKGYWVRTSAAGVMNLPAELAAAKEGDFANVEISKDWGKILISNAMGESATIYTAASLENAATFELPPVPPAGVFDVRFDNQHNVNVLGTEARTVLIQSGSYPLTVTAQDVDIVLRDKATGGKVFNHTLRTGESVQISNEGISAIEVGLLAKPVSYELYQNYPNPFNPSTTIKFGVPEKSNVSLTIYNQLGQKVTTLLNEERQAGYYTFEWNAANLSSGVYLYELKTDNFRSIKKLILMK